MFWKSLFDQFIRCDLEIAYYLVSEDDDTVIRDYQWQVVT